MYFNGNFNCNLIVRFRYLKSKAGICKAAANDVWREENRGP